MFPFYICVCYKLSVFRLNFVIQDELFAEGLLGILSWMDVSDKVRRDTETGHWSWPASG